MTSTGAAELLVDMTRELAVARADAIAWRDLALAAVRHSAGLQRANKRLEERHARLVEEYRVYRFTTGVAPVSQVNMDDKSQDAAFATGVPHDISQLITGNTLQPQEGQTA